MSRLFWIVVLLLSFSPAIAQSPRFIAEANAAKVGTGDVLTINYVLNKADNIQDVRPPSFDGFQILGSRQSMVNNSDLTLSFSLRPLRPGTYTIPGAVAIANGTRIESNGLRITVVAGQLLADGRQSQRSDRSNPAAARLQQMMRQLMMDDEDMGASLEDMMRRQQQQMQELLRRQGMMGGQTGSIADNLFIVSSPSKTSVFLGEPITVSYKLYTRLGFEQAQISKLPNLNGFYTKDYDIKMPPDAKRDVYNGREFNSFLLKKSVIYPTQAGQLSIDPMEIALNSYQLGNLSIKSAPITISVKALPAPAPSSFGGAVGSYQLSASIDRDSLSTNDVALLRLTLRGRGNITLAEAPKVLLPEALAGSEAELGQLSDGGADGVSTKQFSIAISPTKAGRYTIAPIQYTYFDPAKGQYITTTTQAIDIQVSEGTVSAAKVDGSRQHSGMLQDIYQGSYGSHRPILMAAQPWFWPLVFILLLIPVLLYCYDRIRDYRSKNAGAWQISHADRTALRRLKKAKSLLASPDKNQFYTEVSHALWLYLAQKLNMQIGDLSKENLAAGLSDRGVPTALQERSIGLLTSCEQALYSPMGEQQQRQDMLQEAADIITLYERTWA